MPALMMPDRPLPVLIMCCSCPLLSSASGAPSLDLLLAGRAASTLESEVGTSAATADPTLYARAASWIDKVRGFHCMLCSRMESTGRWGSACEKCWPGRNKAVEGRHSRAGQLMVTHVNTLHDECQPCVGAPDTGCPWPFCTQPGSQIYGSQILSKI